MTHVLTDGASIEIVVAKGTININSEGFVLVDAGTYSTTHELFMTDRDGTLQFGLQSVRNATAGSSEPSTLEKIERYIDLLCHAQRSEHDVHKELTEALQLYKKAAGI